MSRMARASSSRPSSAARLSPRRWSSCSRNRDGLMNGICNGFQALIKLGLVPYGEIVDIKASDPTLTFNKIGRHQSTMVRTKVVSNRSPG
ncbi:MAG: phosphoribosylformylglycinamidine synthase subunit PurQ [Acutalibacteraceae bacterium]